MWKVTEVQPLKMIKYSWEFKDYSGKSSTAFEIFEQDNSTKLRLTVETFENFSDNIPEFTIESCRKGWVYFINNRLKDYLTNK